jgi:hypothetical protein
MNIYCSKAYFQKKTNFLQIKTFFKDLTNFKEKL